MENQNIGNNYIDQRLSMQPALYKHPLWVQGHLYECIDVRSVHTGEVYIASSNNLLISLKTGYLWDDFQFSKGEFRDITSEVWLTIHHRHPSKDEEDYDG